MKRITYSLLIGIIMSTSYIKCEMNLNTSITKYSSPLTEPTIRVIEQFFTTKTSVISILRTTSTSAHNWIQSDIINDIIHATKSKICVQLEAVNVTSRVPVTSKRKYNIIFVEDYKSFELIFAPETIKNFDMTFYYLIVITSYTAGTSWLDTIEKIFKFAWDLYIININVLVANPDTANSSFMYTYYPFTDNKCGNTIPVLLNIFDGSRFIKKEIYYSNKIRNMHQCPINVATFHTAPFIIVNNKTKNNQFSGFEMNLLKTLASRLNFQPIIKIPSDNQKWGEIFPNGTKTGAIRMMIDNEANLTIGSWGTTKMRLATMDATNNYFYSYLIIVVPPGRPYSSFEKLILPLEPTVWIMIVLQFFCSIIVVFVLKFVAKPIRNFIIGRNNNTPLLSMISVFLGGPVCYIPRRNFARTLAMIWMLGCMVIRTSYQGSLFNHLQVQKNYSAADTLDKIIDRNLKFFVVASGREFLESMPVVQDRLVNYNIALRDYYYERVRYSDFNGVLLGSRVHVAFMNQENRPKSHYIVAKQNIALFPITMFVRKGSYLTAHINQELLYYISAGLIEHWKDLVIDEYDMKGGPKTLDPIKLTFIHIAGGYNLCMALLGVSVIVFIFEMLSKRVGWIKNIFDFLTYI